MTAAPVGFCARAVITAARAPVARAAARLSGIGPSSSTATGTARQAQRGEQVEQVGPARILHRDRVTGAQVGGEQALDRVERAAGDGDRGAVDGHAVGRQAGPGGVDELRHGAGRRITERRPDLGRDRAQMRDPAAGSSRTSGSPEDRSSDAGRHRKAQRGAGARDRRSRPDAGAAPAGGLHDAALAQVLIGLGDGGGADVQMLGEDPDRRAGTHPRPSRPRRTPASMLAEIEAALDPVT